MEIRAKFKEGFVKRYSKLTDFEKFKEYSTKFLRRSIRVNTLKISIADLKKRLKDWNLDPIPWCKGGFWIEHKKKERRDVGNLIEHTLGYIYLQESASMIPPLVLDPKPGDKLLDMAASPGSKTTQMASMMKNEGVIVAMDKTYDRLKPLSINLQRCGVSNTMFGYFDMRFLKGCEFDKILVDAPCSGTGTIRKSLGTLDIWNPHMIKRLSGTQKRMIKVAFENLKKGGVMVYSTCSVEPEENEGVVDNLLENYPNAKLVDIKLNLKRSEPILDFEGNKYNKEIKKCLRIWPQDNDSEGFFIAKILKV